MENNKNFKEIFGITIKLLVICSIVAVIVAFVNFITKDKIAYNEKLNTANALTGIYYDDYKHGFSVSGDDFIIEDNGTTILTCSQENISFTSEDIKALYVLKKDDGTVDGYCVSVQPMGFKDYINMLVAITPDLKVKGVEIVSMSETSGIGTKAKDASFLGKFTAGNIDDVKSVDIISGATKTSRPIIDAVADSLMQVTAYIDEKGGNE